MLQQSFGGAYTWCWLCPVQGHKYDVQYVWQGDNNIAHCTRSAKEQAQGSSAKEMSA